MEKINYNTWKLHVYHIFNDDIINNEFYNSKDELLEDANKYANHIYEKILNKYFHYKNEVDLKYFKINYQNEFLKKIYKNTGQITAIEYLDLDKLYDEEIKLKKEGNMMIDEKGNEYYQI